MNKLTQLNYWYDSLKEPKRFFVFFGIMSLWLLPLTYGLHILAFKIFGLIMLALIIMWAISRI